MTSYHCVICLTWSVGSTKHVPCDKYSHTSYTGHPCWSKPMCVTLRHEPAIIPCVPGMILLEVYVLVYCRIILPLGMFRTGKFSAKLDFHNGDIYTQSTTIVVCHPICGLAKYAQVMYIDLTHKLCEPTASVATHLRGQGQLVRTSWPSTFVRTDNKG